MFKVDVYDALQMQFRPSKYASSKTTLQNATPNWNEDITWSPQYSMPTTRTNKRMALLSQEVELVVDS